jgi:leucyl-tRNA synthetase
MENVTDSDEYSPKLESAFHKTVRKVTSDIENMKFNTAIAALMALMNDIAAKGSVTRGELKTYLTLLNPFAPHITEEMWEMAGFEGMMVTAPWPTYDEAKTVDKEIEIPVQINGKLRSVLKIAADADKDTILTAAKADAKVLPYTEGKSIVKEIFVPGKMVNLIVK